MSVQSVGSMMRTEVFSSQLLGDYGIMFQAGAGWRELLARYDITAVWLPDGHDADRLRQVVLDRFDLSLGTGLGKVKGRVFRIGHLGDLNDLTLAGTLCGVEMGLVLAGVPHAGGGVGVGRFGVDVGASRWQGQYRVLMDLRWRSAR